MGKLQYNARASARFMSMRDGARAAGVSYSRFRKAVMRLKLRVERVGWNVLVEKSAPGRVRLALKNGTIRPGRRRGATSHKRAPA